MKIRIECNSLRSNTSPRLGKTASKKINRTHLTLGSGRRSENNQASNSSLKSKSRNLKTLLGHFDKYYDPLDESKQQYNKPIKKQISSRDLLLKTINRHEKAKNNSAQIIIKIGASLQRFTYFATTSERLLQFLKEKYEKVQFWKSNPENVALDYYLTYPRKDISFLNGQSVTLEPYKTEMKKKVTINSFDILYCIGTGGFSKVFLCRFKQDGRFYAMKVIEKKFILENKKKKIVMNEKRIMERVKHPFIIEMKFAFQSQQSLIFVLELCPGGELFGLVKKFRIMNECLARFYMVQILLGLEQIHKNGVVYRDFKPENILIDVQGHIRIADFGLAKPGIFSLKQKAYSFCGSPEYMPPQMIKKKGHSLPVDFYCLGALLYELVTGLPPFYSQNPSEIFQGTVSKKVTFPEQLPISSTLKQLLTNLLSKDQSQRLGSLNGVQQVLAHPWFGKISKQQYLKKEVQAPVRFTGIKDLKLIFEEMKIKNQEHKFETVLQKEKQKQFTYLFKKFDFDFRLCPLECNQQDQMGEKQNRTSLKSVKSCRFSIKTAETSMSKERNLKNAFGRRSGTGQSLMRKKPLTARYLDINLYLR